LWGDGLEQSPERVYSFVIDHGGSRNYVAMRAAGIPVAQARTEMPADWMNYHSEGYGEPPSLVEPLGD
jgi:hypothetical protein